MSLDVKIRISTDSGNHDKRHIHLVTKRDAPTELFTIPKTPASTTLHFHPKSEKPSPSECIGDGAASMRFHSNIHVT